MKRIVLVVTLGISSMLPSAYAAELGPSPEPPTIPPPGDKPGVQQVEVVNFPSVQHVEGIVSVDNLPAVQQVAGSVSVSNLPLDENGNVMVAPQSAGAALRIVELPPVDTIYNASVYSQWVEVGDANVVGVMYEALKCSAGSQNAQAFVEWRWSDDGAVFEYSYSRDFRVAQTGTSVASPGVPLFVPVQGRDARVKFFGLCAAGNQVVTPVVFLKRD